MNIGVNIRQHWRYLTKILAHPLVKRRRLATLLTVSWWKLNQWLFHLPVVVQLTPEAKIICPPSSAYGSYIVYAHFPEFAEMQLAYHYLDTDDVFIDVGSYPGDFALLAASKITRGKVIAVEPNPQSRQLIKDNIALNGWQRRIKLVDQAVGQAVGRHGWVSGGPAETNRLAAVAPTTTVATTTTTTTSTAVETTTVDALLHAQKLSRVDFIKIDVEGAEGLVFAGAKQALRYHRLKVVLFEVNLGMKRYGLTVDDTVGPLLGYRYRLYQFDADGKLVQLPKKLPTVTTTTNWLAVSADMVGHPRLKPFVAG